MYNILSTTQNQNPSTDNHPEKTQKKDEQFFTK